MTAFSGNGQIQSIEFHESGGQKVRLSAETSAKKLFNGMDSLERVTFGDGLDTAETTDFSSMFSGCGRLKEADTGNLDFGSAKTYNSMFSGCEALEEADLSSMDFSNAEAMSYMLWLLLVNN